MAVSRGGVAVLVPGRRRPLRRDLGPRSIRPSSPAATRSAASPSTTSRRDLDRDILDRVARQIGTRDFDVHPPGPDVPAVHALLVGPAGHGLRGRAHAVHHDDRRRASSIRRCCRREYVAVKFYAARSLPDTPEIRAQLRSMRGVARASEMPVVLLDTGLVLEDDHADYAFATRGAQVISAQAVDDAARTTWACRRRSSPARRRSSAPAAASRGWRRGSASTRRRCSSTRSGCTRTWRWRCARTTSSSAGRFAAADLRALDPLERWRASRPSSATRMKVLFIARHFTYFRNFESVIAALAERGHSRAPGGRPRRGARRPRAGGPAGGALSRRRSRVGFTPILQWGRYRRLAGALRLGLDYLRYSDPRYDTTPKHPRARLRAHAALRPGCWRALPGARLWSLGARAARAGGAAAARRRRVPRRAAARRPADHAAHRAGLAAARLRARGARARASAARCACGAGITCRARR